MLERALNSANDAIIGVDLDQRVILWNEAAAHRYGLSADEALGKRLDECYSFEFMSPDDETAAYASLTEDGRWSGRCVHVTRDGRRLVVDAAVSIMLDGDGMPAGQLAVIRDIEQLTHLEADRARQARFTAALNEMAAVLHSSLDSEDVFERAVRQLSITLDAHTCGIGLREGDGWRVKWVVGSESTRAGGYFAADELPSATEAFVSGRTTIHEQAALLPSTAHLSPSQALTTPLKARDETVGVLTVLREASMPFERTEIDFVEQVASAIALALENARLYAQSLDTATLNAALARIETTLHPALDIDSIMERALSYGAAALKADSASIGWREEDGMRVAFVQGMPQDLVGRLIPGELDRHGEQVARTRETLIVADTRRGALTLPALDDEYGVRSVIVAPIVIRGNVEATIYFNYAGEVHEFTEPEESFVRSLASSLSLALDNAFLFTDVRERGRLADALNRIDAAINRTLDFEIALDVSLPEAAEALMADSVVLLESRGDEWVVRRGIGSAERLVGTSYRADELKAGRKAIETRDVVAVSDTSEDQLMAPLVAVLGARASMVTPLIHTGEAFGLLYFNANDTVREWQPQEIDFLSAFGAHLSLAAENARLYAIEHERASLIEALAEIDTLIHGSSDFEEWMGITLEMAAVSIGAESAAVLVRFDGQWEVQYEYGFGDDYVGYRFSDDQADFMPALTAEMAPVIIEHPESDPDVVEWAGKRHEFRSNLIAPLVEHGEVFGVLIFNSSASGLFRRTHVDFVRKFAASVTLGLENQRLYEEESRSAALARALNSVNEALLSTLSVEEMLEQIVGRVSDAAGASVSALLRPDGEEWVVTSVHNLPETLRGQRLSHDATRFVREQARRRRPLLVDDIPDDVRRAVEDEVGLTDSRSLMFLPLRASGELIGIAIFGYSERVEFGEGENEFAERTSTAITLALENARLYQSEKHIAQTLQDTLLVIPHRIPGIEFARIYRPATNATRVGGDFIDAFELTHRRVGFALGDVSGKGLKAASATAMVRNTLRAHAVEALPPSIVAEKTGNVLTLFTSAETFVTAFFATLDTKTGCLDYANAGHPPAYVLGVDGTLSVLEVRGPVLGAFSDVTYRDGRHIMLPGDCLFAYSDGLIEARVEGKLFGEQRLAQLLPRFAGATPEELVHGVFDAVNDFTDGDFRDDVALLAVTRKAQPGAPPSDEFEMLF